MVGNPARNVLGLLAIECQKLCHIGANPAITAQIGFHSTPLHTQLNQSVTQNPGKFKRLCCRFGFCAWGVQRIDRRSAAIQPKAMPAMSHQTPPFAPFEWMIAWRYLRARRAEGGVSVMTVISFVGITLAVFALIATLAVRSGFRTEFVGTILGANAHVTVYSAVNVDEAGRTSRVIEDYDDMADRLAAVEGVTRVAPLIKGQVMASANSRNTGVEVFGISPENLSTIPRIADPETAMGDIGQFKDGVAIGSGVARELNLGVGDTIRLISPDGVRTAFGTSPRISAYEVVYIFTAGRYDIDRTRLYMPFAEAQTYFNRDGVADEMEVMVEKPGPD